MGARCSMWSNLTGNRGGWGLGAVCGLISLGIEEDGG